MFLNFNHTLSPPDRPRRATFNRVVSIRGRWRSSRKICCATKNYSRWSLAVTTLINSRILKIAHIVIYSVSSALSAMILFCSRTCFQFSVQNCSTCQVRFFFHFRYCFDDQVLPSRNIFNVMLPPPGFYSSITSYKVVYGDEKAVLGFFMLS